MYYDFKVAAVLLMGLQIGLVYASESDSPLDLRIKKIEEKRLEEFKSQRRNEEKRFIAVYDATENEEELERQKINASFHSGFNCKKDNVLDKLLRESTESVAETQRMREEAELIKSIMYPQTPERLKELYVKRTREIINQQLDAFQIIMQHEFINRCDMFKKEGVTPVNASWVYEEINAPLAKFVSENRHEATGYPRNSHLVLSDKEKIDLFINNIPLLYSDKLILTEVNRERKILCQLLFVSCHIYVNDPYRRQFDFINPDAFIKFITQLSNVKTTKEKIASHFSKIMKTKHHAHDGWLTLKELANTVIPGSQSLKVKTEQFFQVFCAPMDPLILLYQQVTTDENSISADSAIEHLFNSLPKEYLKIVKPYVLSESRFDNPLFMTEGNAENKLLEFFNAIQ